MLICIYNLTDDETFSLWDGSDFVFVTYTKQIDMFIISDRLCLSVLIFCTVSVIGISVKSHIGTSLMNTSAHKGVPKIFQSSYDKE